MPTFACPACEQMTITASAKFGATSFAPATCPGCRAQVYPSGKKTHLWRSLQALIVTLIVIRALIDFAWAWVFLALLVIVAMETLRVFIVPLVRLERITGR